MTDANIPVTEDELHAYVDDELPAERRQAVDLAREPPGGAAKVASWRAMSAALHAKYDAVADEPVPARLAVDALARPPRRWMMALSPQCWWRSPPARRRAGRCTARGRSRRWSRASPATRSTATRLYVVEVRHPVEVGASERAHLQQWLSRRCGYEVKAPELDASGLKLVGGRLLPGPNGPASFLMYENASGERFTIYASRANAEATQMRYASHGSDGALFWADRGVGYVVSGAADRDRLTQVAKLVYEQNEKAGL